MSLFELVRMVIFNLLRMKVRALMTAAGVMIGTASVVVLVSLGMGLQESAIKSMGNLGELTEIQLFPKFDAQPGAPVAGPPKPPTINAEDLKTLAALEGVIAVMPMVSYNGESRMQLNRLEGFAPQLMGVLPDAFGKLGYETQSGVPRLMNGQMVVGGKINESFYDPRATASSRFDPTKLKLQGQRVQIVLTKYDSEGKPITQSYSFAVSGVLKNTGGQRDYSIYLPLKDVLDMNTWASGVRPNPQREGYFQVLLKVAKPQDAQNLETRLSEKYQVQSPFAIIRQISQSFRVIQAVLGAIGAVALLVAGFGIANTMVMAIYERSREIGLMKAVGATNRDVMYLFLAEAGAIGLLGGVIGNLLALAVSAVVSGILTQTLAAGAPPNPDGSPAFQAVTPAWLIALGIGFSVVVGVVAGLYPALRTTQLDPIAALRTD